MDLSVPRPTLQRLPAYLQMLKHMRESGATSVSCNDIARELGLNPVSVRKDLAAVSVSGGRPKIGYALDQLIIDVEKYLGYADTRRAVLIGVGHLGGALLAYPGFAAYGVEIVAAFDLQPALIGTEIAGKPIVSATEIGPWCLENRIEIGIITVPAAQAQAACDALVSGGVRGVWNFAPTHVRAPAGILVQNEDMAIPLAMLCKHLEQG